VSFSAQTPKAISHVGARGAGYWLVASDGGIFNYGNAAFDGSTGAIHLNKPIVAMASTPDGSGYWLVASDGGIFSYGDAAFYGSTGGIHLNQPIVGMTADPATGGYWEVASDGGIFSYDAPFYGSPGGSRLNEPIVAMASTPDGKGYWLVASDGGIFSYGDAAFYGSTGATHLNKQIVGMAATPSGQGYWLVASDGGIFSYGDAAFYGSSGGIHLNEPIVGMGTTSDGNGYWLVASDGGIFSYGDAGFFGSTGGTRLNKPIVGMAALPESSVATSPSIVPTTSLAVNVSELPAGTNADVSISGPNGFSEVLTASSTITPATPGAWTVMAVPVTSGNDTYYPLTQTTDVTLDSGAAGSVSVDYGDAVTNRNVVATPDALESLSGPDGNGNYTATVSDPGSVIQVGSVLTVAAGTADPNGLFLDVTALTDTGGVDTITGTEASLTDIGPQADIDVSTGPLGGTDDGVQAHAVGARVTQMPNSDEQGLSDPLSCSGSVAGTLGGSVSFSPSIDFSAKWGGILHPGTFTASMSMSGTEQTDLNAEIDAAASCTYDQDIPPAPIVLAVIDIQIGPVPVILTPELDFELEASGTVEGKVEDSATQTMTATAGVAWNGSSMSPIASLSNSFTSQAPTVSLDGTLHAQIGPQLSLLLYGLAGPYISADAFATLNASTSSTPWWTLTGGFGAGGGIELDIFGEQFSEGDPSILSKTWTIAQATTPAPLSVGTQTLEDATQGSPYSQSLSAQGGIAPYSWVLTSGSLPNGISLSPSGTISGTPSGTGTSSFSVKVTDGNGATATTSLSIDVELSGGGGGGGLAGTSSLTSDEIGDCALLTSGGVDCWGYGVNGELGDGVFHSSSDPDSAIPVSVLGVGGVGALSNVSALASDDNGYCAVITSGGVDCWGDGAFGQLGDASFHTSGADGDSNPTAVVGVDGTGTLSGVSSVVGSADGLGGYCSLLDSGDVDCWGYGEDGELGDGVTYTGQNPGSAMPVPVLGVGGDGLLSGVARLTSGRYGYCAVLNSGGVDCWGSGAEGELGNGVVYAGGDSGSATPVQVVGVGGTGVLTGVTNVVSEFAGNQGYCALLSSGRVDCWGAGQYGQLGNGTTYDANSNPPGSAVPVQVLGVGAIGFLSGALSIESDEYGYCVLLSTSGVDCWGYGYDGELGDGVSQTEGAIPVQVVAVGGSGLLSDVTSISSGYDSYCALLGSGSIDCWGYGSAGELGDGVFYSGESDGDATPVQVAGIDGEGFLSNASLIVGNQDTTTCALVPSGGVDCWGYGYDGELGDGSTYTTGSFGSAVPVQVSAPAP
jgi:alpha-tubulin suppressor-like RCC1 family protein